MTTNKQGACMRTSRVSGFTLIELMVVVVIIAILAAIALPTYDDYVRKTRRSAGTACLLAAAQRMERFYTTALAYNGAGTPTIPQLTAICEPETMNFYSFSFAAPTAPKTYSLLATPIGKQSGDSCGNLGVNQSGTKTPATAGCW